MWAVKRREDQTSSRLVVVFVVIVSLIGAGTVAAQIDCSNIATSAGLVPKELVDFCWTGPSPAGAPDAPTDIAIGPDTVNGNLVDFPTSLSMAPIPLRYRRSLL